MQRLMAVACAALAVAGSAVALEWVPGSLVLSYPGYAIDEMNDRLVVFAGAGQGNQLTSETWEMTLDTVSGYRWSRVAVSGTPPTARFGPAMVYDPAGERMIVFGGEADMVAFGDVWELDLEVGSETWRQLAPAGSPPAARRGCHAIYHQARNSVIVFGGLDNPGPYFDDVWELCLDSLRWRELEPSGTPPAARSDGVVAWDASANRMLVGCGRGPELFYGDLYSLSLEPGSEEWTLLAPGGQSPSARAGSGAALDAVGGSFFVFGGYYYAGGHVFYNDLHRLDLGTLAWQRLTPTDELPAARRHPVFACDAENDRLILLGGDDYSSRLGDWWYMDVSPLVGVEEWVESRLPCPGLGLQVLSVADDRVRVRCSALRDVCSSLRVIDATGRLVRTLHTGVTGGDRVFCWDRADEQGRRVPSGAYYLYLQAGEAGTSRKVALVD